MAWRAQGLSLRALRRLFPRGPGGHVAAAAAVTSTWGSVVPARGNCTPPRAGKAKQSFFTNVVRPSEKKGQLFNANDVSPQRPWGREQQQQKYQQQRQQEEQQWTKNDQQKQQYQRSMVEAPDQPLSPADWAALKKQANNPRFESIVIEKLIETHGDLDIAKSLLNFVALESGDVSYGMLLPYLRLCVANQNVSEFLDVYKIMRDRYSILEDTAYTFAIRGLCMTERWRESLALLEEMNSLLHPTAVNYTDIVKAALARCDVELAFRLYAEMLQKDLLPQDSMLQAFFELRGELAETNRDQLEGILQYLRHSQTFPSEKLARSIGGWFESFKTEKWKARYIHILPQAEHCPSCSEKLESIHLTKGEYKELQECIMNDVIKGHDIYRKTTPAELARFQRHIASNGPYDVVVDSLNVSYIGGKYAQSQILMDVVSHLAEHGKQVLVLGRRHMLKNSNSWLREHMDIVRTQADCFFMENISKDDPFLLYACLHSGNHCWFVTRDLLRDHCARLTEPIMRHLFRKWQRGHQLVLETYIPKGQIIFKTVPSFDTVLQTTTGSWHIPYDKDGIERSHIQVPGNWVCMHKQKSQRRLNNLLKDSE
ncbi:mitochondrial ribonuclease P catalytic subunit [Lampetra fluviatilis]